MPAQPHDTGFRLPFTSDSALGWPRQFEELSALGELAPVHLPTGEPGYLATGYQAVRTVLADPRFSLSATARPGTPHYAQMAKTSRGLMTVDGEEHRRLRDAVTAVFTVRRVQAMRPAVERVVHALVDEILALDGPPVDLHAALSTRLPVKVIGDLLGLPPGDEEVFAPWCDAALSVDRHTPQEITEAWENLRAYLGEQLRAKRERPAEDLLSALLREQQGSGAPLSDDELARVGVSLVIGGHETTPRVLDVAVAQLLRDRALWERLVADPTLIGATTEELLRLYPASGVGVARLTTTDTELAGTPLPAGTPVLPCFPTANRDAAHFPAPETIRPDRPAGRHMTFGHGPHRCLGANLARLELQIVVEVLTRRLPTLRLATEPEALEQHEGSLINHLRALPVAW